MQCGIVLIQVLAFYEAHLKSVRPKVQTHKQVEKGRVIHNQLWRLVSNVVDVLVHLLLQCQDYTALLAMCYLSSLDFSH